MKSILLLFVILALGACSQPQGISFEHPRLKETLPSKSLSVGYVTLVNNGAIACPIQGITANGIGAIEVHEHRHSEGKMMMRQVAEPQVPALGQLAMSPGGFHLMLLNVAEPLRTGQTVELHFNFGDCGQQTQRFVVEGIK